MGLAGWRPPARVGDGGPMRVERVTAVDAPGAGRRGLVPLVLGRAGGRGRDAAGQQPAVVPAGS
jgi:hypothetical protein